MIRTLNCSYSYYAYSTVNSTVYVIHICILNYLFYSHTHKKYTFFISSFIKIIIASAPIITIYYLIISTTLGLLIVFFTRHVFRLNPLKIITIIYGLRTSPFSFLNISSK